jgi:hypothetical protein
MTDVDRKSHEDLTIEVKVKADEAPAVVESLIQRSKDSNPQEGLSFLELKNFLVNIKL